MPPLRLKLERSPLLDRLEGAMHLLAVLSVGLSGIGWPWRLCLGALLLAHYWSRRPVRGSSPRGQQLIWSESAGWVLEQEGGAALPLTILPGTVVSPWWVMVQGHDGRKIRVWAVARDSVDAESFRRLRVCLRVHPLSAERSRSVSDTASATGRMPMP